jgi:hypothetical protein
MRRRGIPYTLRAGRGFLHGAGCHCAGHPRDMRSCAGALPDSAAGSEQHALRAQHRRYIEDKSAVE